MEYSKRVFLSPPHMSGREMDYVAEAFASNSISQGAELDRFERMVSACTGFRHCVAVASGTAAMHLALRHLGVGSGDVVVASTLTFIGSVSSAVFVGADLVFVDSERDSWNMDPGLLEDALLDLQGEGRCVGAVIPTDLYGQSCNLPAIMRVCEKCGVPVICDSAESLGAKYQRKKEGGCDDAEWVHAGSGARAAVYSFNGNKILTTGGGGILASDNGYLVDHARKLATQAREAKPWYEHEEVGYNYRLSNVAAAIGVGQMEVLEARVARRRAIRELYRQVLSDVEGIGFMPEPVWSCSNGWLTVIQIDANRPVGWQEVQRALEADNIETRPVWKPMHMQPVFAGCRVYGGVVAEALFARGLCLPSGTALRDEEVVDIAEKLKRMVR